jgi:hypothetical protein
MKKKSRNDGGRAWVWLLADGDCPICGRRHSGWLRRLALWFDRSAFAW